MSYIKYLMTRTRERAAWSLLAVSVIGIVLIVKVAPLAFSQGIMFIFSQDLLDYIAKSTSIRIAVVSATFLLLLPDFFNRIFGDYPIESIRKYRAGLTEKDELGTSESGSSGTGLGLSGEKRPHEGKIITSSSDHSFAEDYLSRLAHDSASISNLVLQRSGVYLLAGSVIALAGIAFFVLYPTERLPDDPSISAAILGFLPRLGPLIFIELVAFFFLRQNIQMMLEFRYYDALKRRRESTLVLLRILGERRLDTTEIDLLVKSEVFKVDLHETQGLVVKSKGEGQRISKEELGVLSSIVTTMNKGLK